MGSASGFILMPILTHYLAPNEYGQLALFNVYVQLIIPFIGLSASGLIAVDHYKVDVNSTTYKSLFSSISFIPIPFFFLFLIIFLVGKEFIAELLNIPNHALILIPIFALLSVYIQQFFSYLVILKKAKLFSILNVLKIIAEYSLAILFVAVLGFGWIGRVGAAMIIFTLIVLVSIWFYNKSKLLTKKIEFGFIKAGIFYGGPLIAHVIGKFVINQSDKIFISTMASDSELGIYNTGYLIGSVMMILSGAFSRVYHPYLFERLSNLTKKKTYQIVKVSYFFVLLLIFVFLLLIISTPLIYEWLIEPGYHDGAKYVFWIGLSYVFWGVYVIFSSIVFYYKKTGALSIIAIINVSLNLILNYFLINKLGTIGAAYATAISFFVVMVAIVIYATKLRPLPWFNFKEI